MNVKTALELEEKKDFWVKGDFHIEIAGLKTYWAWTQKASVAL